MHNLYIPNVITLIYIEQFFAIFLSVQHDISVIASRFSGVAISIINLPAHLYIAYILQKKQNYHYPLLDLCIYYHR